MSRVAEACCSELVPHHVQEPSACSAALAGQETQLVARDPLQVAHVTWQVSHPAGTARWQAQQ